MKRRLYWALMLGALFLFGSCDPTVIPRTQVVVLIDAEGRLQSQANALRIELSVARDGTYVSRPPARIVDGDALRWPVRFSLVPGDSGAAPKFELTARAMRGGEALTELQVRSQMVEREVRLLRIVLRDACLDSSCDSSCHAEEGVAECGALQVVPEPIGELCDGELCDAPDSVCLDPRPCGCGPAGSCSPDAGVDAHTDAQDAQPPTCELKIVGADGSPAATAPEPYAPLALRATCVDPEAALPADLTWSLEGPGYLCPTAGCGRDTAPSVTRIDEEIRYIPVATATSDAGATLKAEAEGLPAAEHTFAIPSPFPSLLAGLSLWLDAADPRTLTLDANELVWADKSASGVAARALASQAEHHASGWEGRGMVLLRQDGGGLAIADHPALQLGASAAAGLSAVVVYRQPSVTAASGALLAKAAVDPATADYALSLERGMLTFATAANGSCETARVLAPLPTQPHHIVAIVDPATARSGIKRLFADGEALPLSNPQAECGYGDKSAGSIAPLRMGRTEAQAAHVPLELAEVLVFRRALADAERRLVEAYVESKWGLGPCIEEGAAAGGVAMRGELTIAGGLEGSMQGGHAESGELCPPGTWLVGLSGSFVTDGWQDGATAMCAAPGAGLDRCHPGRQLTAHHSRQRSGLEGRWWTACPPGSVVVGLGGAASSFVHRVTLTCAPYRVDEDGVHVDTEAAFSLDPSSDLGGAEAPPERCPHGAVARGAVIRNHAQTSRAGLERTGLLCDTPVGSCNLGLAGDCPSAIRCQSGPHKLSPGALSCRGIPEQLDRWDFAGSAVGHLGDTGDGFVVGKNTVDVQRLTCTRTRWDDFTLSAWARLDGLNSPNTLFSVSDGFNHNTLFLDYRADAKQLAAQVLGTFYTAPFDAELGRYYYITVMRRGGKFALAVDGVVISDPEQDPELTAPLFVDCEVGFVVGQEQDALGGGFQASQSWYGTIDSVTLRYHGLSDAELAAAAAGEWRFDLRGNAADAQGNAGEGFAVGADTSLWQEVPAGIFDGLRDHTLCLRFRADGVQPQSNHLLSLAVDGSDNELLLTAGSGGLRMYFRASEYTLSEQNPLASLSWRDLCVVRQGTTLIAYVDGAQWSATTATAAPVRAHAAGAAGVALLGQDQDRVGGGFSATQAAWGVYDRFTLWDRALSSGEIAAQSLP